MVCYGITPGLYDACGAFSFQLNLAAQANYHTNLISTPSNSPHLKHFGHSAQLRCVFWFEGTDSCWELVSKKRTLWPALWWNRCKSLASRNQRRGWLAGKILPHGAMVLGRRFLFCLRKRSRYPQKLKSPLDKGKDDIDWDMGLRLWKDGECLGPLLDGSFC